MFIFNKYSMRNRAWRREIQDLKVKSRLKNFNWRLPYVALQTVSGDYLRNPKWWDWIGTPISHKFKKGKINFCRDNDHHSLKNKREKIFEKKLLEEYGLKHFPSRLRSELGNS
jgi:hypothetical protein